MNCRTLFALAVMAAVVSVCNPFILEAALLGAAALSGLGAATLLLGAAGATGLAITGGLAKASIFGTGVLIGAVGAGTQGQGSNQSYSRSRRSVKPNEVAFNNLDEVFSASLLMDRKSNCGLRLVCEVSATPDDQLDQTLLNLKHILKARRTFKLDPVESPEAPYQMASLLGNESGNPNACVGYYKRCKFSAQQMLAILKV